MFASSGGSSAASSIYSRRFRLGANTALGRGGDDLDASRQPTIENAVFGVLFTLSKENSETRIVIRWVLLKILLDGWQVFTTVIQPSQGWDINEEGTAWKIVSVLGFGWVADLGYGAYMALLYGMVALLAVNIGLCVWVAWCFKEQKFPVVWPIKVLRFFTSVFFQAFDIASLNLLQVGITCRLNGPKKPHMHLALFPDYSCAGMPHVVHAVVSGVSLLVFVVLALLTNMAEVEVNPKSRRPMALGHSGAEVMAFALKVLMTLVDVFLGWPKVAACVYLVLSSAMTYQYMRWSPSLVGWVNHLKAGCSIAIVWCSGCLMLLEFQPGIKAANLKDFQRAMTLAMLAGIGPTLAGGFAASVLLTRRAAAKAKAAIGVAAAKGAPLHDVLVDHWAAPRDVEIAARCCRVWVDRNVLDKDAVARAQTYIKAGLAMFPGNAFVTLLQANFMIDVLGVTQSGMRQVEAARKMNPGIVSRFIIFVRMQQAQQKAAGSNAGGVLGTNMDLLGFVEYQRKQRMVVRLHREALTAMCNFWKALDAHNVSFTYLSKALAVIEVSVTRAQSAYHLVLETYGTNYRLVRLYGKFLETVKNDPWGALEYYTEADRLEQEKNDNGAGPLLPDGTPLSRMDDLVTAVLLISSVGEIQMANKQVHHMFGYKKGELDGKLITLLLAPQSSKRMLQSLTGLVEKSMSGMGQVSAGPGESGGTCGPTTTSAVLGMHRERMAFPMRVTITKATGVGEDSTFIALLEPVHVAKDASYFWVAPNGVIAGCDPQFVANFGYLPHDVVGSHLGDFLSCDGDLQSLRSHVASVSMASALDRWELDDGPDMEEHSNQPSGESVNILHNILARTDRGGAAPCHVSHRFCQAIACEAAGRKLDLGDAVLFEIRICRASQDPFLVLVTDRKGAIRYSSPLLTTVLCPRGSTASAPRGQLNRDADAFDDRTDSMHKGAGHGLAILSGVASAHGLMGGYNLRDFLPNPWKDIHTKFLKDATSQSGPSRSLWSCTRPVGRGGSMEMHDAHGQRFFMHVAVNTAELVGEQLHIIRMARSTKEQAVAERRLRLQVNSEGIITAVGKDTPCPQLFGFEPSQVVGRSLWEVVDGVEQQLLDRPGSSLGRVTGPGQGSAAAFAAMLERVIRSPGRSWRVTVAPPATSGGAFCSAVSRANAELAAAQRAAQIRSAVMTVHIPLLSDKDACDSPEDAPGGNSSFDGADSAAADGAARITGEGMVKDCVPVDEPAVIVDLWPVQALSGVMELNSLGRITAVQEEHTRPAGLLFGVATSSLLGQSLTALVPLPPGRKEVADLLSATSRSKKSSLKQTVKDPTVKVGPVHVLQAMHSDGRPVQLAVQVVGKPRSGEPLTVLLRLHVTPVVPAEAGDSGRLKLSSPLKLSAPPATKPALTIAGHAGADKAAAAGKKAKDEGVEEKAAAPKRMMARLDSTETPSLREMEEFVDGRSMDARVVGTPVEAASVSRVLEMAAAGHRLTTPGRPGSSTGLAHVGSARGARPATPSTPVKSPAELLAAVGSDSNNGAPGTATGVANGTGTGSALASPLVGAPLMASPPSLAGMELPLPGVVTTGGAGGAHGAASRAASARREQLVLREAGPTLKRISEPTGSPTAAPARTLTTVNTLLNPGSDDEDEDDDARGEGSAGKGSAGDRGGQSDDPDAVQPVAKPKTMDRIQEWVLSKGELFQNAKPKLEAESSFALGSGGGSGPLRKATKTTTEDEDEEEEAPSEDMEECGPPSLGVRSPPVMSGVGGGGLSPPFALGSSRKAGAINVTSWSAAVGTETAGGGAAAAAAAAMLRPPSFDSRQASGPPTGLFAPPQPAYPPLAGDFDDTASNGGQSVMSGNSASTSGGAEYKRGKRFRNLVKLMDSSEAEQVLRRFRWGSLLTMAVLAAAHTVCFALVVISVKGQQSSMYQLTEAGRSTRQLHVVLLNLRSIDQIFKGKAPPHLYNVSDVQTLADAMYGAAVDLKNLNNEVAEKNWNKGAVRELYYTYTVTAWLKNNVTTGEDIYSNLTMWDMTTKVFTTTKEVYQNYRNWSTNNVNLSSTDPGQFLLKSGTDLGAGLRQMMNELLTIAMASTAEVNNLLWAFLVVEGCGVSVLAAALLAYLLRKLALQRYTLYGTFLVIPVGLTRALSSQLANTTLLEEEDDDDEEEDGPQGDEDHDKAGAAASDVETTANNGGKYAPSSVGNGSMAPSRHATLAPSATMNTRRRPSFQAAVLAAYAKASAAGETQDASRTPGGAGGGAGMMNRTASGHHAGAASVRPSGLGWRDILVYRFHLCCSCLARRSHTVHPTSPHAGAEHNHKRHLKLDSHDTARLLIPFVVWSCLVVTFYAVSVAELRLSKPLVAIASVSNFNTGRAIRAAYYAQELAAEESTARLPARREALKGATKLVKEAFYTMQLGDEAIKILGPGTERFPLVSMGMAYASKSLHRLFYSNTQCLRMQHNLPCPGPEYRFYELTHSGLDSMMQVFLTHLNAMAEEVTDVVPGLYNPHLDYIYNVGTKDLSDANRQVRVMHYENIKRLFSSILLLHILLFVLLWTFLATFYFFLLKPLLLRLAREKRHIAELLSQLPLELDVEKMVRAALAGPGRVGPGGSGGPAGAAEMGVAAGGGPSSALDPSRAWKNVLRSTSNAISQERERRNSVMLSSKPPP